MQVPRIKYSGGSPAPKAGYLRGHSEGVSYALSSPPLRDFADDIKQAWTPVTARTIEALQNNGWIAGGIEAAISLIIGTGLKLNAKPDYEALGWTASEASAWAKRVEKRYEARCRNKWAVDANGRYTSGQMESAHLKQVFATGDGITQFLMIPRAGVAGNTRMRLLSSAWLSRETDTYKRLQQGVLLDGHGAPRGYRFRLKNDYGYPVDVDYRARDRYGRPIINHVFDGQAGQFRGISIFAPVLPTIHKFDRLTGSTLAASLLHSIYAVTVESEYPTEQVLAALGADDGQFQSFLGEVAGAHKNIDIKLGDVGKIPHLLPGETLNLQGSKYPNSNFEPLANFLLREVARCLGCLFEDLTGDYRGATYSSLQNGIAKNWPITLYRREHIAVPFKQSDFEAWLEEDIDLGLTPFPEGIDGFIRNREAACGTEWRGPPKPVADDLKTAKANEIYHRLGVKSQGRIAGDLGDDIETVHEELESEQESRTRRNLPEPVTNGGSQQDDDDDDKVPAKVTS